MVEADETQGVDPGLLTLILTLRSRGISAELEPIRQRYGWGALGIPEMLRCASDFGLKARTIAATWEQLVTMPMPVIAALCDGGFLIIVRVGNDKVTAVKLRSRCAETMMRAELSRAELETMWDGRLVVITRRSSLWSLAFRSVRPLTNIIEGLRRLVQKTPQPLMRHVPEITEAPVEPAELPEVRPDEE